MYSREGNKSETEEEESEEKKNVRLNNKIKPFAATWMDIEIVILSEVSQIGKDKYHTESFIYGT